MPPELNWSDIDDLLGRALAEDLGDGDATTTALFDPAERATAFMTVKAEGIVAGLPVAERVFRLLDPNVQWRPRCSDGDAVHAGEELVEMEGTRRALLSGERLALNLLQRLSGIASAARRYSDAVAGLPVTILDTRKTVPGLRRLEKYAVAAGGATNHRMGLFNGIMLKDNHLRLAGDIETAVARVKARNPHNLLIEVETGTLDEVDAALRAEADIIMLDNMDLETMREAVRRIAGRATVEASGGITLERVRAVAETGVDVISVGALTHSVTALDIGMYVR